MSTVLVLDVSSLKSKYNVLLIEIYQSCCCLVFMYVPVWCSMYSFYIVYALCSSVHVQLVILPLWVIIKIILDVVYPCSDFHASSILSYVCLMFLVHILNDLVIYWLLVFYLRV